MAYHKTNTLFAAKAAEIYRPGDLIIVHDYHLLLAPKMIRESLSHVTHNAAGWGTVTPSPAALDRKGMDWENQDKGRLEKLGGFLGNAATSLSHLAGHDTPTNESRESREAEIMIGMFVHTPWPSSEVFRCLPSMFPFDIHY